MACLYRRSALYNKNFPLNRCACCPPAGLFLLWMLLGLFLLLVADALGVVLVLVGLRNGALVLKVLGAAPLASFRVDPATWEEPGAHAYLVSQLGRRRSRMAMRSLLVPAGVCCVCGLWGNG